MALDSCLEWLSPFRTLLQLARATLFRCLKVLRVSAYASLQTCYSDFKERLASDFLAVENGAGFYSPPLRPSRSFFHFFSPAHLLDRPKTKNQRLDLFSSRTLTPQQLFFCKPLPAQLLPRRLSSPSKTARLLVASPAPVNSFLTQRALFFFPPHSPLPTLHSPLPRP